MKKRIILVSFICSFVCFSQEMYKIDYIFKDFSQNTKCTLFTDNKEAVFKFYDDRAMGILDLPNGDVTHVANDELSKIYYSNEKLAYCRHLFNVFEILYFDEYKDKVKWTINTQNKKKIGKYNCTEATTRLNGRNYTAWFTFEVPIKYGPMKFHNLPGLIIEVNEDSGYFTLSFEKISKTPKPKEFNFFKDYFLNTKKNVYAYSDYEKKVIEKMVARKIRSIESVKRANLEGNHVTVDEDILEKEDVNMFVDIPTTLLHELKKYHY